MIKYILCPGMVKPINGGEEHYVSALQLIRLYNLKPGTFMILPKDPGWRLPKDAIHLYPLSNGNYQLPEVA